MTSSAHAHPDNCRCPKPKPVEPKECESCKTKDAIITQLHKIIADQAEALRKNQPTIIGKDCYPPAKPHTPLPPLPPLPSTSPTIRPYWDQGQFFTTNTEEVKYSDVCACNPKNGGSGICNCILGGPQITC